jgi:RNA polymerase sigma-70 factor (ECF subfamily)
MTEKTDFELLNGSADDFIELHNRYTEGVKVYLYKHKLVSEPSDAEDILQLVWMRAYSSKSRYNPGWAFSTWLCRIAFHIASNFNRDKERILPANTNQNLDGILDHREPRDPLIVEEIVVRVREAVADLPENAREAIEKVHFSNMRFAASQYHQGYKRARRLLKCPLRPLYNELSET